MILALAPFFVDCALLSLFAHWTTNSLLFYFLSLQVLDTEFEYTMSTFYFPLLLILLQDFLRTGRFGFGLVWLVPLIGIIWGLKKVVVCRSFFAPFALTALGIFLDSWIAQPLIGAQQPLFLVTIYKICYTWICGVVIFLGLWGNRCSSK